jgi:hypothetical protein
VPLVLTRIDNTVSLNIALEHSSLFEKSKHASTKGTDTPDSDESDEHPHREESLRIGMIVHTAEQGEVISRVNNLHTYMDMNRHVSTSSSISLPPPAA